MRMPARLSGEAFSLDSFVFYRRRFFSKDSGFHWSWDLFCNEEILSGLDFTIKKEPGGTSFLRFCYTATGPDSAVSEFDYLVELDRTSCRQGRRWWFRCPCVRHGGKACGERCRFLYLRPGPGRFACRRCSGLAYLSSTRNHNPIFTGYIQPTEALRRTTEALLRSRSPERQHYLEREAEAARRKIAGFSKRWRKIASRVVTGKARVRDRRYFEELVELLLGEEARKFVETAFREPDGAGDDPPYSVDGATLASEMLEGLLELARWKEFPPMLKAARSGSGGKTRLALASIMTRHLSSDADYVLSSLIGRKYVERLAQDPEALLKYIVLVEREGMKRLEQLFTGQARGEASFAPRVG